MLKTPLDIIDFIFVVIAFTICVWYLTKFFIK